MKYLIDIDSDWLIDGLGGRAAAVRLLQSAVRSGSCISIISYGEVLEGGHGAPSPALELRRIQTYLGQYVIVNLSETVLDRFAEIRYGLRVQGMLIPDLDLLIAATALEHNLILLTRNLRHFSRIVALSSTDHI